MVFKVWQDLTGTMQSIFKFGRYRLKSYIDKVAIEGRQGAEIVEFSATKLKLLGKNITKSAAIPTTGTYAQGDIVLNQAPSSGDPSGWVCVTAGTPGTWEAIGSVTGDITFDGVKVIGDGSSNNLGSIELVPSDYVYGQGQYVRIRPTVAIDQNHIHIERGSNNADLFLGDDLHYVKLDNTNNTVIGVPEDFINQNVTLTELHSNVGYIQFPKAGNAWWVDLASTNVVTLPNASEVIVDSVSDGGTVIYVYLRLGQTTGTLNIGAVVTFRYASVKQWTFDNTGVITFPDGSTQSTAGGGSGGAANKIINGTSEVSIDALNGPISFQVGGLNFGELNLGESSGTGNLGIGELALNSITTGDYNIGVGTLSLSNTTTGYSNIATGNYSLFSNTTGSRNNADGASCLAFNTTGSRNSGFSYSLSRNTTGNDNVGIGYNSLALNTTGSNNVALGNYALFSNTTRGFSTAIGTECLANHSGAEGVTAIGNRAFYSATNVSGSIAIGSGAGYNATTGNTNTIIGNDASFNSTVGGANTVLGFQADFYNVTGSWNVAIGKEALRGVSGQNHTDNTGVGNAALYSITTGGANTALGSNAGNNLSSGNNNVLLGRGAASSLTTGTGNIVIGHSAQASTASVNNEITLGDSSITSLRCAVTSITSLSDIRDKTNIIDLPLGLEFLSTLRPVKFDWNTRDGSKTTGTEAGFIAQELKQSCDSAQIDWFDIVNSDNPDKLEASAGKLLPVLVKAIQELETIVKAQADRLVVLESNLKYPIINT